MKLLDTHGAGRTTVAMATGCSSRATVKAALTTNQNGSAPPPPPPPPTPPTPPAPPAPAQPMGTHIISGVYM